MILTKCQKDMLFNSVYNFELDRAIFVCKNVEQKRGVAVDLENATDCDIQDMIHNLLYSFKPYCEKCPRYEVGE